MLKVLVTGGAGFIGSHLVESLLRSGYQVLVIDDLSSGKKSWVPKSAKFTQLDVHSPKLVDIVKKFQPNYVCHLAGNPVVSQAQVDPANDAAITVVGTVNILQAVKNLNLTKFLYVSSCAVYGNASQSPTSEAIPPEPDSAYAMSRLSAENYVEYYANSFGLPVVIARLTRVFGPRQLKGAMARFVQSALKNESFELVGRGEQVRDWLYISDTVAGLQAALLHGSGLYNLSSSHGISMRELVLTFGEVMGMVPKVNYVAPIVGEPMNSVFSCNLARRELNWQAEVPLLEGIRLTLKWWKEQKKL